MGEGDTSFLTFQRVLMAGGTPVLLIHDLSPLSSSYEWCRYAKKLEKQHTVYTIDLLGCGRSEKPYLTYTNQSGTDLCCQTDTLCLSTGKCSGCAGQ